MSEAPDVSNPQLPWFQVRLLTIIVLVAAFALCAALWKPLSDWYHTQYRHILIYRALNQDVRPGDTIDDVQLHLGPGVAVRNRGESIRIMQRLVGMQPASYPDGVEDTDTFIQYDLPTGESLILQFRAGRIVNHNPKQFNKYQPMSIAAGP